MFKLYNILYKRYNKKNKLITFIFVVVAVIFLVFLSFSRGLKKLIDAPYKSDDLKEINVYPFNRHKYTNETIPDNLEKQISNLTSVNKMIVEYSTAIDNSYNIYFTINDQKINIVNQIKAFDFEYDIFSSKDENIKNLKNSIILGNYKNNIDNGILIDENILFLLGYDSNNIIGEKIKFNVDGKEIFLEITGVYDRRVGFGFFRDENFKVANENYKNSFLENIKKIGLTNGFIFNKKFVINYINDSPKIKNIKIEARSLEDVINIHTMIENNSKLFVKSSLGTVNNYLLQVEKYSIIMAIVFISLAIALLIFTILTINLKLIKQNMFIKMLNITGYYKKNVFQVYIYDVLFNLLKIIIFYSFAATILTFMVDSSMRPIYSDFGVIEKNVFVLDFSILVRFIIFHSIFHLFFSVISCFLSVNKVFKLEDILNDT